MAVTETRQLAIYLDKYGRVVEKSTLSADRSEVTYLPTEAVRVVTTPQGWNTALQTGRKPQKAGYDTPVRRRQKKGRQASLSSRPSVSTFKYRPAQRNDFNYFGAYYKLHMYSDGCGEYLVGEEVEQSYFKPRSSMAYQLQHDPTQISNDLQANSGPRHTITDSAVAPNISSLYFAGTGDNAAGHTGGILYVDHHHSLGFTTGWTSASNDALNHQYMHADFWIKPVGVIKHDCPIFAKAKQTGFGGTAAMEFGLVARNNGLAWKFSKTSQGHGGSLNAVTDTIAITGITAQKVVGLAGVSPGGTSAWHHVQIERSLQQFRFYVDGELIKVQHLGTGDGIISDTGDILIGGHRDGRDSMTAYIDQFHYRLGVAGATIGSRGTIGRGYLGNSGFTVGDGTYQDSFLSAGATIAVPTTGCEELRDSYTRLLMPMDGVHLCPRVVDRGNHRVTGRVVGWNAAQHDLYIDNLGFTGEFVSGTGDQGSEYFSRDYGWVFAERGDQQFVGGLRNLAPSTSDPVPSFSATSSALPSPSGTSGDSGFSPSISPTPSQDGTTIGESSPSPTISTSGIHPTIPATAHPSPHVSTHPDDTPEASFTCTPSASVSPSVSPTVSTTPTTTLGAHEILCPTPSPSDLISPTEHLGGSPTTTLDVSASGPETSPSSSPSPTTSATFVSPHPSSHQAFSPTPSPSGTTGDFGSPHPDSHSHAHPNISPSEHQAATATPTPTLTATIHACPTVHGGTSGTPTPSPTIHFSQTPSESPVPSNTEPDFSPHPTLSPTPHWFHPTISPTISVNPHPTNTDSPNSPCPSTHLINSPTATVSRSPRPTISPSPSIQPTTSPPPPDMTGSLATYEMCDYDQLLTLEQCKDLAREEARNEATRNINTILQGTQGHNGEFKYLFEDSAGSSGDGSGSVSEPDGSGTRTFGGITNPETGVAETYHFFTIRPTNDIINRLNAIVTAGNLGKQDSYYVIPNAFGAEHYLTYHDCRLLFLDLVNYRYKVNNAFTSSVGAIDKATQIAEVRTTKTKLIPADKSTAFKSGRRTAYQDVIENSSGAGVKTGYKVAEANVELVNMKGEFNLQAGLQF